MKSLSYTQAGIKQLDAAHGAFIMTSRYLRLLEIRTAAGDLPGSLAAAAEMETYRQRWIAGLPNDVNAVAYGLDKEARLSQLYDSPLAPSMNDPAHALKHARLADAAIALLLRDPSNAEARSERAFQLRRYSYLHGRTDPETGVREGREAIAILEQQQRETAAANHFLSEELASDQLLVAGLLSRLGRAPEARGMIDRALALHAQPAALTKASIYFQCARLRALTGVASCYRALRDLPAALETNRQATALAEQLEPQRKGEVALLWAVGNAYVEYARYWQQTGARDQARQWLEKDAAIWRGWEDPTPYIQLRQRQSEQNLRNYLPPHL
jgi:tetratricopeptide (TPR) repeat protein